MKNTFLIIPIIALLPFHHLNYGAGAEYFQETEATRHTTAPSSHSTSFNELIVRTIFAKLAMKQSSNPEGFKEKIQEVIAILSEKLKKPQASIAQTVGVAQSTISNILMGKSKGERATAPAKIFKNLYSCQQTIQRVLQLNDNEYAIFSQEMRRIFRDLIQGEENYLLGKPLDSNSKREFVDEMKRELQPLLASYLDAALTTPETDDDVSTVAAEFEEASDDESARDSAFGCECKRDSALTVQGDQEVRIPISALRHLQSIVANMLQANPASPKVSLISHETARSTTAVAADGGVKGVVALESRTDGINLHKKNITFSNAGDFLIEVQRFVEQYQRASRTDSFVVDLSANSIDGGFLEKLSEVIEPVKDRVIELRLHQNELYLRSIEQLAPLLLSESFKYLTVYSNFIGARRLLAFGEGIYDEDADDGYDAAYLKPDDLLKLPIEERRICLKKMIWIPKAYFKNDVDPTNVPTVEGLIRSDEILRIHRTYYGLTVRN